MSRYPEKITSLAAQEAMKAHTNINHLGALIALCESSLFYGARLHEVERKIVAICQKEQQAQLRIMDKATGRIASNEVKP